MNKLVLGIILAIGFILLNDKGGEKDESIHADKTDVHNGSDSGSFGGKHNADKEHSWDCVISG